MNRLIFITLLFYLCVPTFAAERINAFGLGNGHLTEGCSYSQGNFASVLFKATPTERSSDRLMYAYQRDNPDTTRKSAAGLRTALKLLFGTMGGVVGLIVSSKDSPFFCDDNNPDCYEDQALSTREKTRMALSVSFGMAVGVTMCDRQARFVYTLAGSLLGMGTGIAIHRMWGDTFPFAIPILPLFTTTIASEWSRDRNRLYSLGVRPEPRGRLSVISMLRF